jgi:hypothetical protein
MLLTTKNIHGLQEIVGRFHAQFILEQAGPEVLTPAERKLLQTNGVDLAKYKGKRTPVEEAFIFGKHESSARNKKDFNRLDLKAFRKLLDENPELSKLTREDKAALKLAKQSFANDVRRLAGDIKSDLHHTLLEVSKTVEPKTSKKRVLNTIAAALAENTKRYSGRMELISGYRLHETFQSGISNEILQRLGPNAKVYFSLHPEACPYCRKTYLKKNGLPKIFLLSALIKNGSNIGRKAKEYLPSISPLHPKCRCRLVMLPRGEYKWSERQRHYIRLFK